MRINLATPFTEKDIGLAARRSVTGVQIRINPNQRQYDGEEDTDSIVRVSKAMRTAVLSG